MCKIAAGMQKKAWQVQSESADAAALADNGTEPMITVDCGITGVEESRLAPITIFPDRASFFWCRLRRGQ